MEENKTALVDSNTENTPAEESKFNPISFTEGLMPKEETDENVVENTDTTEVKEETQEDDWSFEDEATPATDPNEAGRDEVNWARVAAELGLDSGSTKEEIKQALKNKEEAVKQEETVDEFAKLQEILRLDDKSIMVEELKARGFAESEIEDYVDRLEDAGTLKYEALKVKNDIRKHIVDQETQAKAKEEADQKEKAKQVEENKLALQKTIKEREDFYGYNLGKEQKKEVYNYITSGDFYKDLSASHEEVFEQAMFKLFKERVFDLQSKKGYEDGKSQILDNITSPDLGRTSKPRPMSAKGFDPSQFSRS
jgi:hypothetical protein